MKISTDITEQGCSSAPSICPSYPSPLVFPLSGPRGRPKEWSWQYSGGGTECWRTASPQQTKCCPCAQTTSWRRSCHSAQTRISSGMTTTLYILVFFFSVSDVPWICLDGSKAIRIMHGFSTRGSDHQKNCVKNRKTFEQVCKAGLELHILLVECPNAKKISWKGNKDNLKP